jgi:DnaK suppressor protein
MFVSILQLMGFPVGKPVNSRASENNQGGPARAGNERIKAGHEKTKYEAGGALPDGKSSREGHAQALTARRTDVKALATKTQASSKAPTKATASVSPKASKPVARAKAPAAAKPLAKSAAKPVVKPVGKTASKPAAKPVLKTVKPPVSKIPVKPTAKAASKAVLKVAPKVLAKVSPKAPAKATSTVAKVKVPARTDTKKETKILLKTKTLPVAVPTKSLEVPITVLAPAQVLAGAVPARAGRPSSRLAQLTVPSMAQSVASTAAKASYTQIMSSPLIAPPPPGNVKKDPKLANNWKNKQVNQITDAELLAMPDSEYMNATQMAVFRLKLNGLKQDILANAGETTEHLREDTVVVPDPADRATIEEEHALELRTRDRERKLLKKIEQSIGRIDAGDYGYCDETGEAIGVGRLLARPTATLSLEAQQRRELKQKMFGD